MIDDLPEGWTTVRLIDVADVALGKMLDAKRTRGRLLPYLRNANVRWGTFDLSDLAQMHFEDNELDRYNLLPNDLLVCEGGEPGRAAVWMGDTRRILYQKALLRIRTYRGVEPRWVMYNLQADAVAGTLEPYFTGTTIKHFPQQAAKAYTLALSPATEQCRVVAKVEALLIKVKAVQERLDKIARILKRFRQAVLASACSGRLTADWRAATRVPQRPSEIIMAIRQRRLNGASTETQRQRISEVYSQGEEGESETLPSGWEFVRLSKLADSLDYGTSARSNPTGAIPVLRMGNLQNGEIDWANLVFTSNRQEIKDYELQPNTVLFNRTNSPELVGKTAIYRGERRAIFAGYLIRVNVVPELDAEYLNLCLNTSSAREFCTQVKTDGVSQSNINAQKLGAFEVPYCSIHEQREIVRRVNALLAVSDKIAARYTKATAYVTKLTQSILAKAFRGELVPTEAVLAATQGRSYETAEELFARIRRDSASVAKGARPARARKAM